MATYISSSQMSTQRPVAMVLALVSAMVLSPLYVTKNNDSLNESLRWNSGFVLPMVLAGLIIAIKTTSSTCSRAKAMAQGHEERTTLLESSNHSWVLRIGGSSWGLAGVLVMLMLVLSWQDSVQHFLWK